MYNLLYFKTCVMKAFSEVLFKLALFTNINIQIFIYKQNITVQTLYITPNYIAH